MWPFKVKDLLCSWEGYNKCFGHLQKRHNLHSAYLLNCTWYIAPIVFHPLTWNKLHYVVLIWYFTETNKIWFFSPLSLSFRYAWLQRNINNSHLRKDISQSRYLWVEEITWACFMKDITHKNLNTLSHI